MDVNNIAGLEPGQTVALDGLGPLVGAASHSIAMATDLDPY